MLVVIELWKGLLTKCTSFSSYENLYHSFVYDRVYSCKSVLGGYFLHCIHKKTYVRHSREQFLCLVHSSSVFSLLFLWPNAVDHHLPANLGPGEE